MKTFQVDTANQGALLIPVEMPQPEPGPDDVLVRVHAAGVTPTELLWYPTTHTKDGAARTGAVPGHEFSGVVAALGAKVRGFAVGDAVYGMNDWFAAGATAEYCVTLPQNIAKKPATLSHEAAATVPIAALTAWQGLLERAKLRSGERVFVQGGAGAAGLFAVQLAHLQGAYVIATVSGRDMDFVKQLGADEAIDYSVTPYEKLARSVDVVFDAVGGDTLERSWNLLKPAGRMVTIAADSEATTDQRVKDAFFIVEPNQNQLVEIAKQLDAGRLHAFIKAAVPFDQASDAYSGAPKSKNPPGKVVVVVTA